MQVTVNGLSKNISDNININMLLQDLDLTGKRLAVEINQEIIPRSLFDSTMIKPDDKIEIVHAIGGG